MTRSATATDAADLLDFLVADGAPNRCDPRFQLWLREHVWWVLRTSSGRRVCGVTLEADEDRMPPADGSPLVH